MLVKSQLTVCGLSTKYRLMCVSREAANIDGHVKQVPVNIMTEYLLTYLLKLVHHDKQQNHPNAQLTDALHVCTQDTHQDIKSNQYDTSEHKVPTWCWIDLFPLQSLLDQK